MNESLVDRDIGVWFWLWLQERDSVWVLGH